MHILSPEERHSLLDNSEGSIGVVIAKAEQKHTLKHVGVMLDLMLKHSPFTGISFRRAIGLFAEELEKEANSG